MGPAGDSGARSFSVVKGKSLELALVRHEPAQLERLADQLRELIARLRSCASMSGE
jgi:hypothetical protein